MQNAFLQIERRLLVQEDNYTLKHNMLQVMQGLTLPGMLQNHK